MILENKNLYYILGLLWADGYINLNKQKYRVSIEILKDDGIVLQEVFKNSGYNWRYSERYRKNSKRKQCKYEICSFLKENKSLSDLLIQSNYKNRKDSHINIINLIPEEYRYLWIRGFFDGDGCFSVTNRKDGKKSFRIFIYSCIEQDWGYFFNLFDKKDIRYRHELIYRKNGKHKSSQIIISGKYNIDKFIPIIYPNNNFDNIGLKRKYDKAKECIDSDIVSRKTKIKSEINVVKRYDK